MNYDSMNIGKRSQLGKYVVSMRISYFDIYFSSQMKLTKFSLIHCSREEEEGLWGDWLMNGGPFALSDSFSINRTIDNNGST